jgi:hypothetical protein
MKLHCGDSPVKGFGEISCHIWRRPYFHEYLLKGSITSIRSLSFLNCRCKICPHPTIACDLSILSLLIRFILCFVWGMGKDRGLSITSIVLQISTSWSLLGLGVEVGLAPNIMKGISIFLFSIVWFIFLIFF